MAIAERVLEVRGLLKVFGREAGVRDVDLHLDKSEVISLLGPSGCGKTTTLRCIAGFYKPDGGSITIGGKLVASADVFVPPEDRQIAMVFQNYVLWPHMTAFQNVAYGLRLRAVPRQEIETRVSEILALLGLVGLENRYPHQLSGGQQQRISVARSLVVRPQLLLLDEPFSNLDAKLRIQMRQEMRDLFRRLEIAAVYVTHDQDEAMVVSDRILLMDAGRLVEQGTPSALFEQPRTQFAASFFGVTNMVPGTFRERDGRGFLEIDSMQASVELPARLQGDDGNRYLLGLRDDGFEVKPALVAPDSWVRGQIKSRYYTGGAVEVEISCMPGQVIHCRIADSAAADWPADVAIRIVADRAVLLPSEPRVSL